MKIDVFDTYAFPSTGNVMHFDVLVPNGTTKETVLGFAETFLASLGVAKTQLKTMRCNFCHSEQANAAIIEAINKTGHFILQMEGCPQPYKGG